MYGAPGNNSFYNSRAADSGILNPIVSRFANSCVDIRLLVFAERTEEGVPSIFVAAEMLMSGCFKVSHDLGEAHQLCIAGPA